MPIQKFATSTFMRNAEGGVGGSLGRRRILPPAPGVRLLVITCSQEGVNPRSGENAEEIQTGKPHPRRGPLVGEVVP